MSLHHPFSNVMLDVKITARQDHVVIVASLETYIVAVSTIAQVLGVLGAET